jgi:hypothetical protein
VAYAYTGSATFTPAANSHTAGDCNGAAAEFANVGPAGAKALIVSATIKVSNTAAEATGWRLHLYSVTPVSALADDAAWSLADADLASYLGYIDLGSTATDQGANQFSQADGIQKAVSIPASGSLFGYLVNDTTLTPGAVAHLVTLSAVGL